MNPNYLDRERSKTHLSFSPDAFRKVQIVWIGTEQELRFPMGQRQAGRCIDL